MVRARDDKRDAILQAATTVFSERGFVGSNLDEVVATAAISKQTLYKHFADKATLFRQIVLDIGNRVDASFLNLTVPADVDDIGKWIDDLALRTIRTMMDPKVQRIRRLVIAEAPRFPEVAADYWNEGFVPVLSTLTQHFKGLADIGLLAVPDPFVAAQHFVGLLLWIPSNRTMFGESPDTVADEDLNTYARAAARAFLRIYGVAEPPVTGAAEPLVMCAAEPQARIGVVSWKKPQWRHDFYPKGLPQARELEFISRELRTLEIDTTFYGLKRPSNFVIWRDEVPDGFVFSVKGTKSVTHEHQLEGVAEEVAEFFASGVLRLQEKLGPILWQLPASLRFRPRVVEDFLALLPHSVDEARRFVAEHGRENTAAQLELPDRPIRHALEARNSGFGNNPRLLELLRQYDVAAVVTNSRTWPVIDAVTSDFVYVRLHADMTQFADGYDDETLERWAARIGDWVTGTQDGIGRDVFVYFDNSGFAGTRSPFDAKRLQEIVGGSSEWQQAPRWEPTLF